MQIVNDTPYQFHSLDCSPSPRILGVSFIVKGTFKLRHHERAEALDVKAQQGFRGDETFMDDVGRSLEYATDLTGLKSRGEVMMNATCYAEGGRARSECDVSMRVGTLWKTLRVAGDRKWSTREPRSMTRAQP